MGSDIAYNHMLMHNKYEPKELEHILSISERFSDLWCLSIMIWKIASSYNVRVTLLMFRI